MTVSTSAGNPINLVDPIGLSSNPVYYSNMLNRIRKSLMKCFLPFIIIFFIFSCNCFPHKENFQNSSTVLQDKYHITGIDSITVSYWGTVYAGEYLLSYANEDLLISDSDLSIQKRLTDGLIIDKFLRFINTFFVARSENIEYSRVKSSDWVITDYPRIAVIIYLNNGEPIKQTIQIGSEVEDIEYNPKFLEFYSFMDSLFKEYCYPKPPRVRRTWSLSGKERLERDGVPLCEFRAKWYYTPATPAWTISDAFAEK